MWCHWIAPAETSLSWLTGYRSLFINFVWDAVSPFNQHTRFSSLRESFLLQHLKSLILFLFYWLVLQENHLRICCLPVPYCFLDDNFKIKLLFLSTFWEIFWSRYSVSMITYHSSNCDLRILAAKLSLVYTPDRNVSRFISGGKWPVHEKSTRDAESCTEAIKMYKKV